MRILALDQARNGAWSVFDYEKKKLIKYGCFSFAAEDYTFARAILCVCDLVDEIVKRYNVSAVFIEDIQLRQNVDSFKKLAQLQGGLISNFERNEYLYDFITPSKWQSYCNARGRTAKEIKSNVKSLSDKSGMKSSKILSIQYVLDTYGVETNNDNIADAISIGDYVVNNIEIIESKENEL